MKLLNLFIKKGPETHPEVEANLKRAVMMERLKADKKNNNREGLSHDNHKSN